MRKMYLSNNELYKILESLNFETQDNLYPFSASDQIQLCSIDIRLSNIFWYQRKLRWNQRIDLKHGKLYDISPTRLWKKRQFVFNDKIILKPSEMIIGQTFEKFTIPLEYAGKIITRSSYTRLGIETSCTNDFINPGYRGRVPLEIINNSKNTIVIYPLTPICQIMLIPLSSSPEGNYGDVRFSSKYQNEDGSPSLWWRDNLMKRIECELTAFDYTSELIQSLSEKLSFADDDCLDRFHKFIENIRGHKITTSMDIYQIFVNGERIRYNIRMIKRVLFPVLTCFPIGIIVNNLTSSEISWSVVSISFLFLLILVFLIIWVFIDHRQFITEV